MRTDLGSDIGYRADIDGLRAVAVLAVVGYHGFPDLVRGGFTGVDIFFVISGYLISGIVLRKLETGSFSFRAFYVRRVRRIFPALLIVLAASFAIGWFALLPDEFAELGKHIAAGAGFVSNLALWLETGYFDSAAELKPLLHLWSLGIEEQFYIVWPVILWLTWRWRLDWTAIIMLIIVTAFWADVSTVSHDTAGAFYSPFTRFWELAGGGLLAAAGLRKPKTQAAANTRVRGRIGAMISNWSSRWQDHAARRALAPLGIGLITVGIVIISRDKQVPGWWTLLPTLGAGLVIAAGRDAWFNRVVLSSPALAGIGLISFPLYLWHWPLLSFARIVEERTPGVEIRLAALAASFLLAWLTYALVEKRIRRAAWGPRGALWLCVAMAAVGVLGYDTWVRYGFDDRAAFQATLAQRQLLAWGDDRMSQEGCWRSLLNEPYCLIADPARAPDALLIGDSHANHFYWGLAESYSQRGLNLAMLGNGGCVPFFDTVSQVIGSKDVCMHSMNTALAYAMEHSSVKTVLLASRGPLYVMGNGFGELDNHHRSLTRVNRPGNADSAAVFEEGLRDTLKRLLAAGKSVILIVDVPELGFDIRECLDVRPLRISRPLVKSPCAIGRDAVEKRNALYWRLIHTAIRDFPQVRLFDPNKYLCDKHLCWAILNGTVLYRDGDHLSLQGSRYVGQKFSLEFPG